MMKVRVSTNGQIVIPIALRRKYGIKHGTRITITDQGDAIILKPVITTHISRLRGSLKGKGLLKTLLEERCKDCEQEDRSKHSS